LAAVQANLETANSSLAAANEKCASLEVDLAAVKDGGEATNAQMEEKKGAEIQQKVILFYSIQTFHCGGVIINKKGL